MTSLSLCLTEPLEGWEVASGFLSVQQRMFLVLCWALQADGLVKVTDPSGLGRHQVLPEVSLRHQQR